MSIIDDYLYTHSWANETRDKYGRIIRAFLAEIKEPENVKPVEIIRWFDTKPWGDSYRYVALCAIRAFVRWKWGDDHPVLALKIKRGESGPQRVLNQAKLEKLLEYFDTSTPKGRRDLSICTLFVDTGLRVTEVARLNLKHLDLQERHVDALTKGGIWERKTLSHYTVACLITWLGDRSQMARPGVPNIYVGIAKFTRGKPMTRSGIQHEVGRWGQLSGIGELSPHDLRRTMATLATRKGAPQSVVMAQGGWKSEKVFQKYVRQISPEDFDPYSPVMAAMQIPVEKP